MDHEVPAEIETAVEMFVDDPDHEYTVVKEATFYTIDPVEDGGYNHNFTKLKPGHKITFLALWSRRPGTQATPGLCHLMHLVRFPDGFTGYVNQEVLPGSGYFKKED